MGRAGWQRGRAMNGRMRKVWLLALSVLSACAGSSTHTPPKCEISRIGPISVINDGGSPIIEVTLNGRSVAMLVDTGAEESVVTPQAVKSLGLRATSLSVRLRGVIGVMQAPVVKADTLKLANATASNTVFIEASLPPVTMGKLPLAGLFGADFLRGYDVLFDLPHRRITLFHMKGCSVTGLMGKDRLGIVPFTHDDPGRITLPATVNGTPIDLMLDSGSNRTTIMVEQAMKAGVTQQALQADENVGTKDVAGLWRDAWKHRFDRFQVGPLDYRNVELIIAPLASPYALLGADFLWQIPIWVSYHDRVAVLFRHDSTRQSVVAKL